MLTETEALEQGYTIDRTAPGRVIAYKGRRFAPTAVQGVLTPLEAAAIAYLKDPGLPALAVLELAATELN
jgi:hypothetical protein